MTFDDHGLQLVVAMDRFQIQNNSLQAFAWAFSPRPGIDPFKVCATQRSDCTPNGPLVAMIANHKRWLGHPAIAYEGAGGNVVIVSEVDTDGDMIPERIVAVVSNDGGRTFGTTQSKVVEVNDAQTSGGCANGVNISPSVSVDYSIDPPVFHIAWNNKQHSNFGACYRTFVFNQQTNDLVPTTNADGISNFHTGSVVAQASDALSTVMLKNDTGTLGGEVPCGQGHAWNTSINQDPTIPPTFGWSNPASVWGAFIGDCPIANRLVLGIRGLSDFIVAPDGTAYFAMLDSSAPLKQKTRLSDRIRVFMSSTRGAQVRGSDGPSGTWRELCGPQNNRHWSWGCANPPYVLDPPAFSTFPGQEFFNPTLAADELGNLLLTYGETDPTHTKVHVTGWLMFTPRTVAAAQPVQLDLASDFDPGTQMAISFDWLGFYNDTATNSTRRYDSDVAGCTIPPDGIVIATNQGTLRGGFFPVWVQRDQGGPAMIATRIVSVVK